MADPEPPSQHSGAIEDLNVTAEWDAGDMGCGEVIILLRMRMQKLSPGAVFKLTARDLGAPEDIPAWCRLTGTPPAPGRAPALLDRAAERVARTEGN